MGRASPQRPFSRSVLELDPEHEVDRIATFIRCQLSDVLHRRGVVIGLSGGVDSSVAAAICVRAIGADRVLGLLMPDRDSDPDSLRLGGEVASFLAVESVVEDIDPVLGAARCFERRDDAIRTVFPEYSTEHRCKVVIANARGQGAYTFFHLEVESPNGQRRRARLPARAHLEILAATSFKQRTRKMMEYFHADRLHYAVVGTPNRLEYDQGFFVKNGDGAADLKPIAHLYKTQVYRLAEWLGIPWEIRSRPPTTDTYSLRQSQEEFYFSLPLEQLDLCLWGYNHGVPAEDVGTEVGLSRGEVELVYADIEAKRRATRYLHLGPQLVSPVFENDV